MYGLSSAESKELVHILYKNRTSLAWVKLFGSRARGDAKKTSDIDLAVLFATPGYSRIADAFEQSLLPYTVDIIDYATITNANLRQNIDRDGKLLFCGTEGLSQMTVEQLKIKLEDYCNAINRLEAALQKDATEDDMYLDATIQRFEFSFELAWKLIKAYLDYEGIEINSPRSAFREGFKQHLLTDAVPWLDMLEKRNLSTHTYDEKTAYNIYHCVKEEYFALLSDLRKELTTRLG